MTEKRPLTPQEIDDGWCLEPEAPPQKPVEEAPYHEYTLDVPREQASWEQEEGKKLLANFWDRYAPFGVRPPT